MKEILIIIPCYNEEASLAQLFLALKEVDTQLQLLYKATFLFVDDGSTDNTFEILVQNVSTLKSSKVVRHDKNKNLGAALKTGISYLTDETFVAFLDSDCTYAPRIILEMLARAEKGNDIVTASPYHPEGGVEGVPEWRLFLSKGASFIYRVLLFKKLYTYTAMVRVIRRDKINSILGASDDFSFVAEMMVNAIREKLIIDEFPTLLKTRKFGFSKMSVLKTIVSHLKIIKKIILNKDL